MTSSLRAFIGLSLALAKAQFKLRNEGTWLGILWYLLAPLLTFALMLGIFADRLGADIPNYPLYLLLGIILFNFFRNTTSAAVGEIRSRSGLIKSLSFQRQSLLGAVVLQMLFAHAFEIVVLLIFLIIFDIPLLTMLFYPLVLAMLTVFTFGVSLILSAFYVYFFDLQQIWGYAAQLIWFATPIFYEIGGQDTLLLANLANPMYYFITIARDIIIYTRMPEWWLIAGALGYTLAAITLGWVLFSKLQRRFAEMI